MTKDSCQRFVLTALLCLASVVAQPSAEGKQPPSNPTAWARQLAMSQTGTASWYGGSFIGRKTANGERYHASDRTAAHRKLPFGTYVRVTNLKNNRVAIVRINNRGPFTKGRIIDVSRQAAVDLKMIASGTARVRLEVLSRGGALAEPTANLSGIL